MISQPDPPPAYVAVAQMTNQLESEKLAYAYMLQRYKNDGNATMVRTLEETAITDSVPLPDSYLSARDSAMHSLGIGTTHDMTSVGAGLLLRSFQNREYTLNEKIGMWRGKIFSGSRGVLHLHRICAQPLVRGAEENARDHAGGRTGRRKPTR